MKNFAHWMGVWGLAFAASCSDASDGNRIPVDDDSTLGVASIEVNRFEVDGDQVFELRGFDAHEQELARVRLRTGVIGDLAAWIPGDDNIGSEITFSVAGHDTRMVTRETELFRLDAIDDRGTQTFLELSQVSAALEREANIVVHARDTQTADIDEGREIGLATSSCWAGDMLTSPLAKQCCIGEPVAQISNWATKHVNPSNAVVRRNWNPWATGCKASNGTSSCSGANCYYGPAGFARPILTTPPGGTPYPLISVGTFNTSDGPETYCMVTWHATQPNPVFGNVTGTFPVSQGCPGGGGTGAGQWDY